MKIYQRELQALTRRDLCICFFLSKPRRFHTSSDEALAEGGFKSTTEEEHSETVGIVD
jgi:hypothetical protein